MKPLRQKHSTLSVIIAFVLFAISFASAFFSGMYAKQGMPLSSAVLFAFACMAMGLGVIVIIHGKSTDQENNEDSNEQ